MPADKCDYKIVSITEANKKVTVVIRIYEGEVSILDEEDDYGDMVPVERYRRSLRLDERLVVFTRPINIHGIKGNLNRVLKDDFSHRIPIDEQS